MAKPAFQIVETEDLFEYPIGADDRLDSHFFLAWRFHDWLTSDFRLLADLEVRAIGFDLFNLAQTQNPVGTLPTDERLLARLVGVPLDQWRALCERPVGPLYNWKKCLCDDDRVRLYHPKVLQTVQGALGLRDDKLAKREDDRARKRIENLPAQMMRAGASAMMAKDEATLFAFDEFLVEHFPKKMRRPAFLRRALEAFQLRAEGLEWRAATGL
ncbi:hypothetical protein [Pararhodobacter zhoushanensis]|uniref:Uncharacterized protein n=1 Tax=Pararhodobacter zhoushanensis TaxID=2479545 RepID=A0ABT3H3Z7_9RHOB|nr:hypothetical protein [Pararhodobacter zhoushanensis]MCW1934550.1 hypothetical protein [Pararhodobacter zhoushanensis]